MKAVNGSHGHYNKYYWVLALATVLASLVFVLHSDGRQAALRSQLAFAGTSDTYTFTQPTRIIDTVTVESGGTLSITSASMKANGAKSGGELALTGATITLEQSAMTPARHTSGAESMAAHNFVAPLFEAFANLEFSKLHLKRTLLQVRRPGGRLQFVGRIDGAVINDEGRTLRASGTFMRHGIELNFEASLKPELDASGMRQLTLTLRGPSIDAAFRGRLASRDGVLIEADQASISTPNLKRVFVWLGLNEPVLKGFGAFKVEGQLSLIRSTLSFEQAQISIDGNKAQGRFSLNLDSAEAAIEGTLAFSALDLRTYMPNTLDGEDGQSWADLWGSVKRNLLVDRASESGGLNADMRVSADSVTWGDMRLGSGAAVLTLQDGIFQSDIAEMILADGGAGSAQIEIDTNSYIPRYVVRGDLTAVDLGVLSQKLSSTGIIDGNGDVSFDLSASGWRAASLVSTLSGTVALNAPQGASLAVNVPRLFESVKSKPFDGWSEVAKGETTIDSLTLNIDASAGRLATQKAEAVIGKETVRAAGTMTFPEMILDVVLSKTPLTGPDQDGPAARTSRDDALQMKGPLSAPVIRFVGPSRKG